VFFKLENHLVGYHMNKLEKSGGIDKSPCCRLLSKGAIRTPASVYMVPGWMYTIANLTSVVFCDEVVDRAA